MNAKEYLIDQTGETTVPLGWQAEVDAQIQQIQEDLANSQSTNPYAGDWDASTNTPNLATVVIAEGHALLVTKGGTQTINGQVITVAENDYLIFKNPGWGVKKEGGLALIKFRALQMALYSGQDQLVYQHPNGPDEYAGNTTFDGSGLAYYMPAPAEQELFNFVEFKGAPVTAASIQVRLAYGDLKTGKPDTDWTTLSEQTLNLGTDPNAWHTLLLASPIRVPAGKVLILALTTRSAVKMRGPIWNNNTPGNRVLFFHCQSTAYAGIFSESWVLSSPPAYLGVPLRVSLKNPYVKPEDLSVIKSEVLDLTLQQEELESDVLDLTHQQSQLEQVVIQGVYKPVIPVGGEAEWVGDTSFNVKGGGNYIPPRPTPYLFNTCYVRAALAVSGSVTLKVYLATSLTGKPDLDWVLLESQTQTWDTMTTTRRRIALTKPYSVPAGMYLVVLYASLTSNETKIRYWNGDPNGNRGFFVYTTSTNYATLFSESWGLSALSYRAVPLEVGYESAFVPKADYDTLTQRVFTAENKINSNTTSLASQATALASDYPKTVDMLSGMLVAYSHADPNEYVGNTIYNAAGGGNMAPAKNSAYPVDEVQFKAGLATSGEVTIRLYAIDAGNSVNLSGLTPLYETKQTWNTDATLDRMVRLPSSITVPANKILLVAYSTLTNNLVKIRRWDSLVTGRLPFYLFETTTDFLAVFAKTWARSSGNYQGTPLLVRSKLPYVTEETHKTDVQRLTQLETDVNPRLTLASKLFATAGSQLNLYYDALVLAPDKGLSGPVGLSVEVEGSRGKTYERSWSYDPQAADVGTTTLKVKAYNAVSRKVQEVSTSLIVQAITPFVSKKNVLIVSDSRIQNSDIVAQAQAKLATMGGQTPVFIGIQGSGLARSEGRSGWTSKNFADAGPTYWRFNVTGFTSASLSARYTHNGATFTIREINVNNGEGVIRCEVAGGMPLSSGTLTKEAGSSYAGDQTITFTASVLEPANPFWNPATSKLDIANYRNERGIGSEKIDVALIDLGVNDCLRAMLSETALGGIIENFKALVNALLADNPATKIVIQLPTSCGDSKGGWAEQYGAGGLKEEYRWNIHSLRELLIATFDAGKFHANVGVGNVGLVVDRWYGYARAVRQLGGRLAGITEETHVNAVHPASIGNGQYADYLTSQIQYLISN